MYAFFGPIIFILEFIDCIHEARLSSWKKFVKFNNLKVYKQNATLPNITPPGVIYISILKKKLSINAKILRIFLKYTLYRGGDMSKRFDKIQWLLSSPVIKLTDSGDVLLYEGGFMAISRFSRSIGSPTVIALKIDTGRMLPRVLVDGLASRYKITPPEDFVNYSPEGTFDRRFKLWFKENEQIQALSLITPNVMQAIEDIGQKFDVETSETSLYIYTTKRKGADIDALIKAYDIFAPLIGSMSFGSKQTGKVDKFAVAKGITVQNNMHADFSGRFYILFCNFTLILKYLCMLYFVGLFGYIITQIAITMVIEVVKILL